MPETPRIGRPPKKPAAPAPRPGVGRVRLPLDPACQARFDALPGRAQYLVRGALQFRLTAAHLAGLLSDPSPAAVEAEIEQAVMALLSAPPD